MDSGERVFLQRPVAGNAWDELRWFYRTPRKTTKLEWSRTLAPRPFSRRLREKVGFFVRWFGRALLLSPVLVPVALVARWLDAPFRDWVVPFFVVLVLLFFVSLNLFVSLRVFEELGKRMRKRLGVDWREAVDARGRELLDGALFSRAAIGEGYHARGTLVAYDRGPFEGEPLVAELWGQDNAGALRLVRLRDAAFISDAGEEVALDFETPPHLVDCGDRWPVEQARRSFEDLSSEPNASELGRVVGRAEIFVAQRICAGERVELFAAIDEPIADMRRVLRFPALGDEELSLPDRTPGAGAKSLAPYRAESSRRGWRARSSSGRPIVLRRVGHAD